MLLNGLISMFQKTNLRYLSSFFGFWFWFWFRFLCFSGLWFLAFVFLFNLFLPATDFSILLLFVLEPFIKCLFIISFRTDQFEVLSSFRVRIDRCITVKMNEVFLYRNNFWTVFKIPSRISFTSPCIRMSLEISSELTIINHFGPELSFLNCLLAFFTWWLVRFRWLNLSLSIHSSILINMFTKRKSL